MAEPASNPTSSRTVALWILAASALIFLLRNMQEVFIPLALGSLLFYALDRPVDRLQRLKVPRAFGAALVLVAFTSGAAGLGYLLQGQANTVANQLPAAARKFRDAIRAPQPGTLAKVEEAAKELQKSEAPAARGVVRVTVEEEPFKVSDYLWSGSMNAVLFMNQMVMILFLAYFLLVSDDLLKRKLVEFVGTTRASKRITVEILGEIADQIEQFLRIQVFTSAVVGVATGTALWLLGLEGAAFWGLMAGLFNSIPYYGPLLVTGGLSAVAFVQFGTLGMTAAVAGVALVITALEGFFLTPTLMGKAAQMNRVAVFAGLLFWTWLWGVWGLLLAVPLMMTAKVICDRVEDLQPIGRFLGE